MLTLDTGTGEWGFFAAVEVDGRHILFTPDRPDTVLNDAEEPGLDLSDITDVILSHNHADHTWAHDTAAPDDVLPLSRGTEVDMVDDAGLSVDAGAFADIVVGLVAFLLCDE
jgi:glyoxylase-like metal-dependent hydrolase (beta-lactamase superfamily II)